MRQTLTHNTAIYRGNAPGYVTPFGGPPLLSIMYVKAATASIEDRPRDDFAGPLLVDGLPEFEISTPRTVTVLLGDPTDPTLIAKLAELKSRGQESAGGGIALVDPPVLQFNAPAVATMRFSTAVAAARGMAPGDLALYQAEPGGNFFRVPNQVLNVGQNYISAPILRLSERSLFGIFGPKAAAQAPVVDVQPPRTSLSAGAPRFVSGPTVFVASATPMGFTAFDDKLVVGDGLGVGAAQTYYAADDGVFSQFTSTFALVAEGTHTVSFFSVDGKGNAELTLTQAVAVDRTPPSAVLVSSRTLLAVGAVDPVVKGAASDVAEVRYLVDVADPGACDGVSLNENAPRGTCANPIYAGPFPLGPGSHTIAVRAIDNVGNEGPWRFETRGAAGGLGIGRDSFDAFWSVILDGAALGFARANSAGVLLSSAALADAAIDLPWSVFFDPGGRAYAIGGAFGPTTRAVDLAVYKASLDGGAIEARTFFDSGHANNDLVFDSRAPGWIVGAAQTSGPADLAAAGSRTFSLALWRFDPALGTVELQTTYARAGFDVGTGIVADTDGSLWIAGYSLRPGAPSIGGYDLALWHYAADGRTLLGGPFLRPSYLNGIDGGRTARVFVSSQSVFVATPRTDADGGTDMAFLRYDKAAGRFASENAWRAAGGSPSYPVAILPEASGLLVAGGIGAEATEAALWRFGYDGALTRATTVDAGGAKGAVFRGGELWLAVDGSTALYRVQSEAAAAGAQIDLLPPRTSLSTGEPLLVAGSEVFVSSAAPLGFTVADDNAVLGDGLGVGATQTFYAVDGAAAFSRFEAGFFLVAEGTHTISFFSVDRKGNAEQARVRSLSVDRTPPQSALSSSGMFYSIAAVDPAVAGAMSGVASVLYWVDVNPASCGGVAADAAAARGTCANPAYAGPFGLTSGQHTVYFRAIDAVGNVEFLHADGVTVSNPDALSSGGLGIGRDALDAFWSVLSLNEDLAFARANSFGALISSAPLQDAAFGSPWSVLFDAAGRAYAIGVAEGPSTQGADVAIYKATPAGDAIEARILFDSGYGNNDLVLDAKAPGWVVGAAQTSGPADFEAAGERSFALALWKFDPALGAVTLSTTFARGAFDVGAGVAVDADGSLWISGYSLRPDAPAVRGFDLALWHYAANGKTLLGGPFLWPGYLSDFDGTATARVHVSGGSVYIAAPRVNVSSGTDMAFLRFDKVTSRATSESVWRASDGSASYPAAILPEAAGLIVAGGIGAGESQAALWRFGYDGALRGATLADAGGAQGAVLRGAELWLSVDGSTLPYKVLVETPAAGSLIDISTPPAQALAVTSIAPGSATAGTSVAAAVAGTGFDASAALSLERSDVLRGTWTATGSFAQARFSSTLTKLRDGRVLLAGGMLEGSAVGLSAVDLYDPATGIWTAGPPLRQGRNQFASVLLADGRVLVAGGMNGTVIGSVEIYDPTLNTWTAAAPMAYARVGYQLALLSNGRVLAAGGWNGSSALNSAEIYDPVANAWSPAAAMSVGRINPAMTALGNGKVLISGGNNNSSSNASAEVYDPATNAWSAAGSMSAARYLHRFAVLPGGKVLASGGANASATTDSADVYDPATNGWTATGPLGVRRYIHAVVLVNGTPLIIGGENFSTALASTEMYDAAANAWRPGPSLSGTRTWLQAAVLDDGRVLVAGGRRGLGGGTNLNSAELLGTPSAQISATGVTVTDSQRLSGALSLDGAATGKWDVVVRQSGGHIARLAGGFQVLPGAPTLASIAVTPASASILIGATAQFAAAGTYSDGSTRTLTGEVAWSTDVSSVATVTATGLATGVAGGTVRVIASSGTISGRAALTVTVPPLAVTSIAPSSAAAGASVAAAVAGTGFDASAALSLERSDAMRGTWAATGSFTQARMLGTMTKLRDGRVLLAGGMLEGSAVGLSAVDLYDPATGLWTAGPPLRQGRNQHASVMLADGRVLVAGGMNGTVIGSVEIYDPTLNTWTAVAPMASARVGHQLALLSNGRVLAAGGWNGSSVLNSAEIYDPVVNAWSPAASMSVGRINPAMTTLGNGKVLISGGNDNNSVTHASAEIYDPANTWSAAGTMSAARYGHRFVVLPGGKVLAAGGANASATTDSADVYDPATNVWTATGRLGVRRYYHAMVLVNGTPLIIGGENFSTALASTEIYDAAANAWRSGPSLSGMRAHLHAAVLDDGRVLVAGGRRGLGGGTNLNSAELLGTPSVQVAATGVTVTDAQRLSGTLSLTGAATGYWDVVVRETGGRVGRLAGGFQVLPGAPMLASITVTPVSASILAGATAQFAAAGTFTDGSTRTLTGEVAWSTDVSSVATVSAAGLATGVGGGTSRVIAASGAIVGRAALNVAYVATSTVAVGGSPELTLVSTAPLSVVIASTEAGAGAVALGSAAAQGLTLVGTVYDVTRQDPGASAILTWSFDPELVDASTLAIWRFDGISWSSVTVLNQVVSVAGGVGTVTGEVTLTSLFGLFVRDVVAPVTTLLVDGLPSGATSRLIAPASTISFAAVDAGMGVRETRYGLDGGPETVFVSPFRLTEGMHALAYRSIDRAGNLEDAKSASIAVDATAPRTSLIATGGRQYPGVGAAGFYASSDTRIGLAAEDPLVHGVASGLASTEFKETGGAFQAFVASLALTEGAHSFGYRSRDNVGNLELLKSATVFVDAIPPVSAVAVGAPSVTAADGTVHVVPASPIAFTATDPALPSGQAGAGVERVEVSVDGGAFVPAAGPLTFAEGRHDVLYRALDNVGNVETSRALSIQSDATPPATTLAISTPVSGGYVSGAARFVLAAVDPVVDGAASGVKFVRYRVNGGAFVTGPLDFGLSGPDGAYTLEYQSEDNIGHLEVMRSTAVILDRTPPVTMVQVGASSFTAADGTLYVDPAAPVTLAAADSASGVGRIAVSVDGAPFAAYTAALTFAEGRHTVQYRAVDKVGNEEPLRTLSLSSDATPPLTMFVPSGALFKAGERSYAPAQFTYALAAQDPVAGSVASGAALTRYRMTPGAYQNFAAAFSLSEGVRRVEFQSQDNVGNVEVLKSATVFVDATSPVTALAVGNPRFDPGNGLPVFVAAATPLTLSAQDPEVQDVASGVRQISFHQGSAPFGVYSAPFTLPLPDGLKTVDYFAADNVGNAEVARSTSVVLDNTAPASSLAVLGGRQFPGPNAASFYASSDTRLSLPAVDPMVNGVASGLAATQWQDNGGAFQAFTAAFALPEGAHVLSYQSQDRVKNSEVLRSTTILIDAAPPVTTAQLGAPLFTSVDGVNYIAPATPVTLSAVDPALPTGQPGSGVSRIEVAIDGGPFTAYSTALTFAEGRHTILYRAVDNVVNVEGVRTLQIRSDATPPASSLVVGEPKFQLPGSLLVSTRTPFSITSADPVRNDVASGVKDTSFRISGASAFSAFTAPFMMAGADAGKVIEFHSRDNVLNAEAVKSSAVLLDSTPPEVALLSPASCGAGICRVLKGRFPVLGTAQDRHFQSYALEFAPGKDSSAGFALISSGTVAVSSGPLGTWDAAARSGWLTLRLTAADLVANAASVSLNVFVGDPGQSLVLGNHEIFDMPEGVAAGGDGKIYVADRNNDRIAVFSSTGALLASLGGRKDDEDDDDEDEDDDEHKKSTATLRLNKPSGVAVDAAGNIYVADTNRDRVLKLSAAGQVLLTLGQFHHPAGVAVDAASNIYVADTGNRRVQVFSSTGAFSLQFSLPPVPVRLNDDDDGDDDDDAEGRVQLGKPSGIAVDAAGNIYVADSKGGRALKFSAAGQLLLTIPIPGDKPGKFGQPFGVAVSSGGDCLLVSDRKTSRILKFDFLGNANLAFGSKGKIKDDDDAPVRRSAIVFKKPMGLALDSQGNLFVADRNNNRIQKLGLPTSQAPLVVPPPRPGEEHIARDVVDTEDGGKVERGDRAAVDIPAGAVALDLKISVSTPTFSVVDDSNRRRAAEDARLKAASPPVEYGPEGTKFKGSVTLTLPYSSDLVALQKIDAKDLIVRYWNREKTKWEDLESVVDPKTRTVKAKTTHFSLYQVFSGTVSAAAISPLVADAAFTFHDAYAFPNPARGVNTATIRMQTGLADSVEVRVYDVSGRKIHASSNFSLNPSLDDGNGKGEQYTYDHAWDVSGVGSGVYLYVITAKKAGHSDIHKTGRIGVVK